LQITLHLDLSGDGQRTDSDNNPEASMKQRDFLFIQPPGQFWRQIDGTTERWIATMGFKVLSAKQSSALVRGSICSRYVGAGGRTRSKKPPQMG
jgi:hypothetical protein